MGQARGPRTGRGHDRMATETNIAKASKHLSLDSQWGEDAWL